MWASVGIRGLPLGSSVSLPSARSIDEPTGGWQHEGMALESLLVPLGTPAPDFSLPAIDGRTVSLNDFADAPALLVIFLSNHCPYVKRIERAIADVTAEYADQGLATVGISSNDVVNHPDDDAAHLAEQVERA